MRDKMANAQASIFVSVIVLVVIGVLLFGFASYVLSSVNEVRDQMNPVNDTFDKNTTPEIFGEPQKGDDLETLQKKLNDPNIAPPELSGSITLPKGRGLRSDSQE